MKNSLDPDLKRLMKWSRGSSPPQSEDAPFGFAGRVAASLDRPAEPPTLLLQLQQIAWSSVWVSVAILICGMIVLMSQATKPKPASEFSSALSFLASNLPR